MPRLCRGAPYPRSGGSSERPLRYLHQHSSHSHDVVRSQHLPKPHGSRCIPKSSSSMAWPIRYKWTRPARTTITPITRQHVLNQVEDACEGLSRHVRQRVQS